MKVFRTLRRGVTLASLALAGGALVVTTRHVLETPQPLDSALDGEARIDREHGGEVYYNVAGPEDGAALVLLHDFYAGASNYAFRRIFGPLARDYRVFAPDWLGFGMSEHPAVAYTGEFYATMLTGFLRDTVQRRAIVVAHGHAANIAVRAASDTPELFERLVLVAPEVFAGVLPEPSFGQVLIRAAQRVSLGIVPYAMISTRPLLRLLETSRSARAREGVVNDTDVDHLYASAHQFGGQYATLAAMMGELDLAIPNAFALLEPPALVIGGSRDRRHPRADLEDFAVLNPSADLAIIDGAGEAVFEDQPEAFVRELRQWLIAPVERRSVEAETLFAEVPETALEDATPLEEAVEEEELAGAIEETLSEARRAEQADLGVATVPVVTEAGQAEVPEALAEALVASELVEEEALAEEARSEAVGPAVEEASASASAEVATADEEAASGYAVTDLTGTPGDVVPGVTDSGHEGLAAEVPGTTPEESPVAEEAAPAEMLPEAGEAAPEATEEQAARAGAEPPIAPATSIAESSIAPEERQIAGEVDETHAAQAAGEPEREEPDVPPASATPASDEEAKPARQQMQRAPHEPVAHRAPQKASGSRGGSKSSRATSPRARGGHSSHTARKRSTKKGDGGR